MGGEIPLRLNAASNRKIEQQKEQPQLLFF
jgi:hypothetical protein